MLMPTVIPIPLSAALASHFVREAGTGVQGLASGIPATTAAGGDAPSPPRPAARAVDDAAKAALASNDDSVASLGFALLPALGKFDASARGPTLNIPARHLPRHLSLFMFLFLHLLCSRLHQDSSSC